MKKIPLLPNFVTAFGLSCGIFTIFKTNMTDTGAFDWHLLLVTVALLAAAGLADLLDGFLARMLKVESEFGGIFDCLADGITFGVAPPVVVLKTLSLAPKTELSLLITLAAMVFSLCGVLRLVRFAVTSKQNAHDEALVLAGKKNFTGLPIPAAAAALISLNLLFASTDFQALVFLDMQMKALILFFVMITLGYFMVSRWKFPSFKTLHFRVASFKMILFTVASAVVIFYGMMQFFPFFLALICWGYILAAGILSIIRLIAGRKSKTLEDFEPEPDDIGDFET